MGSHVSILCEHATSDLHSRCGSRQAQRGLVQSNLSKEMASSGSQWWAAGASESVSQHHHQGRWAKTAGGTWYKVPSVPAQEPGLLDDTEGIPEAAGHSKSQRYWGPDSLADQAPFPASARTAPYSAFASPSAGQSDGNTGEEDAAEASGDNDDADDPEAAVGAEGAEAGQQTGRKKKRRHRGGAKGPGRGRNKVGGSNWRRAWSHRHLVQAQVDPVHLAQMQAELQNEEHSVWGTGEAAVAAGMTSMLQRTAFKVIGEKYVQFERQLKEAAEKARTEGTEFQLPQELQEMAVGANQGHSWRTRVMQGMQQPPDVQPYLGFKPSCPVSVEEVADVFLAQCLEWSGVRTAYPILLCPELRDRGYANLLGLSPDLIPKLVIMGLQKTSSNAVAKWLKKLFHVLLAGGSWEKNSSDKGGGFMAEVFDPEQMEADVDMEHPQLKKKPAWKHSHEGFVFPPTDAEGHPYVVILTFREYLSWFQSCQSGMYDVVTRKEDCEGDEEAWVQCGRHGWAKCFDWLFKEIGVCNQYNWWVQDNCAKDKQGDHMTQYGSVMQLYVDWNTRAMEGRIATVAGHPERVLIVRHSDVLAGKQDLYDTLKHIGLLPRTGKDVPDPTFTPEVKGETGVEGWQRALSQHEKVPVFFTPAQIYQMWYYSSLLPELVGWHVWCGYTEEVPKEELNPEGRFPESRRRVSPGILCGNADVKDLPSQVKAHNFESMEKAFHANLAHMGFSRTEGEAAPPVTEP